jgi:hypothetical protein
MIQSAQICSASCILQTAYCILHTAYCILHTAYCILHTAYCILHNAYCKLQKQCKHDALSRILHNSSLGLPYTLHYYIDQLRFSQDMETRFRRTAVSVWPPTTEARFLPDETTLTILVRQAGLRINLCGIGECTSKNVWLLGVTASAL